MCHLTIIDHRSRLELHPRNSAGSLKLASTTRSDASYDCLIAEIGTFTPVPAFTPTYDRALLATCIAERYLAVQPFPRTTAQYAYEGTPLEHGSGKSKLLQVT